MCITHRTSIHPSPSRSSYPYLLPHKLIRALAPTVPSFVLYARLRRMPSPPALPR